MFLWFPVVWIAQFGVRLGFWWLCDRVLQMMRRPCSAWIAFILARSNRFWTEPLTDFGHIEMGDQVRGTVTPLSESISVQDAENVAKKVAEAIDSQMQQLQTLQGFADENQSLTKLLLELPDLVSYNIMVLPFFTILKVWLTLLLMEGVFQTSIPLTNYYNLVTVCFKSFVCSGIIDDVML